MSAFDDWYEESLTRYAFNAGLEAAAQEAERYNPTGSWGTRIANAIRALKEETT